MEQYIIQVFSVVLNIVILYGFNKYLENHNNTIKRYKAIENGLRGLIKSKIFHDYNVYVKQGYIPVEEMHRITELHDAYKDLQGNGTVDVLYQYILKIPVVQSQYTPS